MWWSEAYWAFSISNFLSRAVRPLILLDGDEAGRARGNALMKELYFGNEQAVLMLPVVLHKDDCEIEDLIGETVILPALNQMLGVEIALADVDRASALLLEQIRAAAVRLDVSLPDRWESSWPGGFHRLGLQSSWLACRTMFLIELPIFFRTSISVLPNLSRG